MAKIIQGIDAMHAYAADFLKTLSPGVEATVLGLKGDLGAGKTTFVQGVARALGIEESVTSPTFVIEKVYTLKNQSFTRLIHIDAYRLASAEELYILGFKELLKNPHNLILVEWPERVGGALPQGATTFQLTFIDEKTREIQMC